MIKLQDLVKAGLLKNEDVVNWNRKSLKTTHSAKVVDGGFLQTKDGKNHKTPSGAARHLNGNKPIDGWIAWKTSDDKISLAELREKLLGN